MKVASTSPSDIASIAKRWKKFKSISQVERQSPNHNLFLSSYDGILICREYETMNILFGVEQKNKYILKDPYSGAFLGSILEETSNVFLKRQFLGRYRPFSLNVYDADDNKRLIISRPFTIFQSNVDVYDVCSKSHIGSSIQHWHLWRRQYSLFKGKNTLFAAIDSGFLSWDFEVNGRNIRKPCLITRNFTHLLREVIILLLT